MPPTPEKVDCLILCGGLGRRLKAMVSDRPKPMAEIGGRPFLEILIAFLAAGGIQRFIFCIGHKGEMIREYFADKSRFGSIAFSQEQRPLGTGGAIKLAQDKIRSNPFLVVNGDSICKFDAARFLSFHHSKKAFASLTLVKADNSKDSGVVKLHESGLIMGFEEKAGRTNACLINAGVYLFAETVLATMPADQNFSLEYDWFPEFCRQNIFGLVIKSNLVDIGTPERYCRARRSLSQ